jgi:glycosyltransferase involved in cell wall biosynthesis
VTAQDILGSAVIPAHDEAAVISRCLDSLLTGFEPGELDVVVACNGCTDETANIVRSSGHAVRVLELSVASKPAALRAAEKELTTFPRLYLDADVVLPAAAARQVLEQLRTDSVLAARPPINYDTTRSSQLVRRYYRARTQVPSLMSRIWGAGMYGLSAAGRSRFGDYPDMIADDLFVDQHFDNGEIAIVSTLPVVVKAPRRTADLLRILRRTYHGNSENRALVGHDAERSGTTSSTTRSLAWLALTQPGTAIDILAYVMLAIYARLTLKVAAPQGWERDNGSRAD